MGQRRYNHSEIRSWFLMDSEKNISGGVAIEHFGSKLATGYGCDAHLGEPLKGERRERSKINLGTELRLSLLEPERNHERLSVRPCLFNRRLELDPAQTDPAPDFTGSGSGKTGSRSSFCRIQIRFLPDLVPVAAGSRVLHGLSGPVQALSLAVERSGIIELASGAARTGVDVGVEGVGPAGHLLHPSPLSSNITLFLWVGGRTI